ncbi:hypothetical protein C9I56_32600 [Paraburkholderia caribensis]|uniref:Uncharacterized protein n=1 Tax=Paraburkholderia caribensis TaxID=75105 RepID=A0A9Q6S6P2_9BURK|nr:hypothetical protein C9I56_32600 [Paraburkholderia caribensis]QLB66187.1 hypothetical protein A9O66_28465 [Paraburkholderia caribensis]
MVGEQIQIDIDAVASKLRNKARQGSNRLRIELGTSSIDQYAHWAGGLVLCRLVDRVETDDVDTQCGESLRQCFAVAIGGKVCRQCK